MIVTSHIAVKSPTLGGEYAARRTRLPAPQVVDHYLPVERVSNRLPHSRVLEDGIAQVESQIRQPGPSPVIDHQITFPLKGDYGVRRIGRVYRHVGAAFAQLQRLRGGIRYYSEPHPCQPGFLSPVIFVAFEHHLPVSFRADKFERT